MTNLPLPVDKGHCVTTEQRLLYNIQFLLEQLVPMEQEVIPQAEQVEKVEKVEEKEVVEETTPPKKKYKCTYCDKEYDNMGQKLNCAKTHKKKG